MAKRLLYILFTLILLAVVGKIRVVAQPLRADSVMIHQEHHNEELTERNQRFFDSLQVKSSRSKVGSMLYNIFIREGSSSTDPGGNVFDESIRYRAFQGMRIRSIEIEAVDPFDTAGTWFERAANTIHVTTRDRVIRRDLFFKVGEKFDADQIVRQLQLLRSRKYVSEVDIFVAPSRNDPEEVDIKVFVLDSWTITMDASLGGNAETMISLSDANFLGCGTRFEIQTNFNRKNFDYGGNVVKFDAPNLFGSFFHASISAGRSFSCSELELSLEKPLLRPTDYALGGRIAQIKDEEEFVAPDTLLNHDELFGIDFWGGGSVKIEPIRANAYLLAGYNHYRYKLRPAVAPMLNPKYHDGDELLFSFGLYYEKFYTTNMVYGYGSREYLPTGYRAELITGYRWGEFRDDYYMGARLLMGNFHSPGFFFAGLSIGSYLSSSGGGWYQSIFNTNFRWFSNLWRLPRVNIRQFITLNYTTGWNRGVGYEEYVEFDYPGDLRLFDEDIQGLTRFVVSSETDVFTPFQPLGFRLTMYGFADLGTLGNSGNPFKNAFYTTIGVGLRFKNEHLIFSAIQIELGVCLGKGGLLDSRWIEVSNQPKLGSLRYMPERPAPIQFE